MFHYLLEKFSLEKQEFLCEWEYEGDGIWAFMYRVGDELEFWFEVLTPMISCMALDKQPGP